MKCEEVSDKILDYVEGLLSPSEAEDVESHVRACPRCSREADAERDAIALLSRLERVEAPKGFEQDVLRRIESLLKPRKGSAAAILDLAAFIVSRIPRRVAYPLAGILLALGIYLPAVELWGGAREGIAAMAVWMSHALIAARDYVRGFDFLYRLFEMLEKDVTLAGRIVQSLYAVALSSGEQMLLPGILLIAFASTLGVLIARNLRKRRPHNALFFV